MLLTVQKFSSTSLTLTKERPLSFPPARLLLLADTHLGFDDPSRPRMARRRRGPDFFANYERSRLAYALLARHPNLHVFDRPRTFAGSWPGFTVALSGFPFQRQVDAPAFASLLESTGWRGCDAALKLLCLHQAVEGARVGAHDFTFRSGPDVIPARGLPHGFAAVLGGHVHRAQVLSADLAGRPLPAPVVYPGSIERTSHAERYEQKGFMMLTLACGSNPGGTLVDASFVPLPTRPMHLLEIDARGSRARELESLLRERLALVEPDAVVHLRVLGNVRDEAARVLRAASLRALAPPTMTVTLAVPRWAHGANFTRGSMLCPGSALNDATGPTVLHRRGGDQHVLAAREMPPTERRPAPP
jgi:hypothetical protein